MIDDLIEYNRLNIVSNPELTKQQPLSIKSDNSEVPLITHIQSEKKQTIDLKFNTNQNKYNHKNHSMNNFRDNIHYNNKKQPDKNTKSTDKTEDDFVEIKYNSVKKYNKTDIKFKHNPANNLANKPDIKPVYKSAKQPPTKPHTTPEKSFNIYDTLNDESEPESEESEESEQDESEQNNQSEKDNGSESDNKIEQKNENIVLNADNSELTAEQEDELTNLVIKSRKTDIYNNINTYDINNKNNLLLFLIKDIIEYNEHIENHMNNISYTLKQIEDNGKYEIGELLSQTLTMSIINLADIAIDVPFAHMNFCNIFKYIFKYYPNLCLKIILPKNNQSPNTMAEFNKLSKLYNNQVMFV